MIKRLCLSCKCETAQRERFWHTAWYWVCDECWKLTSTGAKKYDAHEAIVRHLAKRPASGFPKSIGKK